MSGTIIAIATHKGGVGKTRAFEELARELFEDTSYPRGGDLRPSLDAE